MQQKLLQQSPGSNQQVILNAKILEGKRLTRNPLCEKSDHRRFNVIETGYNEGI